MDCCPVHRICQIWPNETIFLSKLEEEPTGQNFEVNEEVIAVMRVCFAVGEKIYCSDALNKMEYFW